MTEPGQSLNLPREWVVGFYANRWFFIAVNILLLVALWWMNHHYRFWGTIWMVLASGGVIACIIAANFLLPAFFPSYQYGANYLSVSEADKLLADEDIIYAVTLNGETKGYPRKHLEIPHIAGAEIGGEEVVMTFCGLSNLPVVYSQDIGDGPSDLGILIQTHNNLLMVDRASGELIQQITGEKEFAGGRVKSYPNTMMRWKNFKRQYPQAEVFIYEFNRSLDTLLLSLFEGPMEKQFSEEHGAIFPTLALSDQRLPQKEQIWGLDAGGEQAAFTERFVKANPQYAFTLGGGHYRIVYNPVYDTIKLFEAPSKEQNGVNANNQTVTKGLTEVPLHNGVFWMIWSHWFPATKVFDQ